MAGKKKGEIITFKVDESLAHALEGIPNRSEFIRNSILHALENACPLCKGVGILTPNQRAHWDRFAEHHSIRECTVCNEFHIVCDESGDGTLPPEHV